MQVQSYHCFVCPNRDTCSLNGSLLINLIWSTAHELHRTIFKAHNDGQFQFQMFEEKMRRQHNEHILWCTKYIVEYSIVRGMHYVVYSAVYA